MRLSQTTPPHPPAFFLTNTVCWRDKAMEDPVLGSSLPESRSKLYPPHYSFPCLVVCRMQWFEDEAILCARKSERAARSFSVTFKGLIPSLFHVIRDAEGRKYHPFKTTILYFWCYDIKTWNYDILPLLIVHMVVLLYLRSFLNSA